MKNKIALGLLAVAAATLSGPAMAGFTPVTVPEPATLGLLAMGLGAAAIARYKNRK